MSLIKAITAVTKQINILKTISRYYHEVINYQNWMILTWLLLKMKCKTDQILIPS